MSFTLIQGEFTPYIGQPDGDTVRFVADDLALWSRLEGDMQDPGAEDSLSLRLEAIDAIEKGAIKPLSTEAKTSLFELIGAPMGDRRARGYILANRFEKHGRVVAFAFAGEAPEPDGSELFLDRDRLRDSVNYGQVAAGYAYPLFYNTLYRDLRLTIAEAVSAAQASGAGYWATDATLTGTTVTSRADLDDIPPVWPKLWRRLEEYLRSNTGLGGFLSFLDRTGERLDDLTTMEQKGFNHFVEVSGNFVRLNAAPENLRVVSRN